MLVIISDLHLTDGSSGTSIGKDAYVILKHRVAELAEKASWRGSEYDPVCKVDIVLLGDVFDLIRSAKWTQNEFIRPWDDMTRPESICLLEEITQDIVAYNKKGLDVLRSMAKGPDSEKIKIPKSFVDNIPSAERQIVDVNIIYMVGNHDWFFHLSGDRYTALREIVVDALGLANDPKIPFPYEPHDCQYLEDMFNAHNVYACHGDKHDPINYDGDRCQSSLGDAIVVELINKFPTVVKGKLGHSLPAAFIDGLKEIDNVRPVLSVPFWIQGLIDRTIMNDIAKKDVKDIWNDLVKKFFEIDFVKSKDGWGPDYVDLLQVGLTLSKHFTWTQFASIAEQLHRRFNTDESYGQHACKETKVLTNEAKYVVYGHTHHFEVIPINSVVIKQKPESQFYFNSGTWKPLHQIAESKINGKKFLNYAVMSILIFYQDTERSGRGFETWSGVLGC